MEQRRTQRYKLQLPLRILQLGERRLSLVETTLDISSGGVCFQSDSNVEVGGRIEYMIRLSGANPPVHIRCLGKVLRSEHTLPQDSYEVAVTMDRYQFVRDEELEPAAAMA